MSNWTAFILAALALLATPGPTNTMLATSGAAAGFTRSLKLIPAENLGYWLTITSLALVIGPWVRASHELSIVLRVACALFLFYSAWKLWREGAETIARGEPVQMRQVFVVTALNPKAIIFAFVILPYLAQGQVALALPYIAALAAMMALVACAWIGAGAALRAGAGQVLHGGIVRRVGALVLCTFAALLTASTLTT